MGLDRRTLGSLAVASIAMTGWATNASATTEPAPEPQPTGPTNSGASSSSDFSIAAALAEIPAEVADEAPYVSVADLTAVAAADGLLPPATDDDLLRWIANITGNPLDDTGDTFAPVVAVLPEALVGNPRGVVELDQSIGFTPTDVEWFADASAPPSGFTVFGGPFDESTLVGDLVPVEDGIVSLGEGADFEHNINTENALSRIGVPQRLAAADGRIAVSPSTDLVRSWLAGEVLETAADDPSMLAIAEALDAAGAVSAMLTEPADLIDAIGPQATPEQVAQIRDQLGVGVLDDSFDGIGVGWHSVDGEPVITFVYALEDGADADAALESVRAIFEDGQSFVTADPISNLLVLDDVVADGSVVVATLHLGPDGRPWTPFDMLVRRDVPFATSDSDDADADDDSDSDSSSPGGTES